MEKKKAIPGKVPGIPKNRKWLFRIILILAPVLVIFFLEISLRLIHYGKNFDLFIEYPGKNDYLVLNPDAPEMYYTSAEFPSHKNNELFKKVKDKNTTRIFVLGGYSIINYPSHYNDSSRWLQYRLMTTFPHRQFEIIYLSLTTLNSYAMFGLAQELVKYKPDAVLIYAGHDEYYEALGVGSTNYMRSNPRLIKVVRALKKFRVSQFFASIYQKITRSSNVGSTVEGKSLIERMVKSKPIAYRSKIYNKGFRQFTSNMNETLNLFEKLHIPVYVSNLVSNERDLKPLNRKEAADTAKYPGFNQEYQLGIEAFAKNDSSQAYCHLQKAISICDTHAMCSYYLGKLAYLRGSFTEAKKYFTNARDFDELRFRASGQVNEIISQLCTKYKYAWLVDTKAAFDSIAENHIIGNDLMLDHIHPNPRGYKIMTDVFYNALKEVQPIQMNNE